MKNISVPESVVAKVVAEVSHPDDCAARAFAVKNRHLPAHHPGWAYAPKCSCGLAELAKALFEQH